jgi:branched-chain amino acid transport system permease protein
MIKWKHVSIAIAIIVLILLPWVIRSPYAIHIMIMTAIYAALALSYNYSIGEVGTLSLVHATFFGAGGYTAALLTTKLPYEIPFLLVVLIAGAVGGILALLVGFPTFRLPERSFAIGTLAFAMIAQQVVHNWVSFTRGPMCVVPIPPPNLSLPFTQNWQPSSVREYYYVALAIFLIILFFSNRLVGSRIGRAFNAVREAPTLATSLGIHTLKYKMLAFVIGAIIAAGLGVLYGQYLTIMCPSDLSFAVLINLLIMVYVGGVGSTRGVLIGAFIFVLLPELLRVTPEYRMLIYGVILLLATDFVPEGLDSVLEKIIDYVKKRFTGRALSE